MGSGLEEAQPHVQDAVNGSPNKTPTSCRPPNDVNPEEVVAVRSGAVLLKNTILKSDHFPGCQNMKLTPLIEGAPNFRQVPGLPVYGIAIPTVTGLRLVLDKLGASKGRRRVLWHSMREEPVIYINGRPFVVREADKPFANLEYTGIDRERVEAMEARLKQDVLQEAAQYGHAIMVAHEDDQFQVVEQWEAVTEVDVQTPLEVYQELLEDGYDVDYLRVPVTDEKAPKDHDFELLIQRCWEPPAGAALVFNCQMGRGRTTTGMIIASLLHLRKALRTLAPPPVPVEGLPAWFYSAEGVTSPRKAGLSVLEETELKAGKFAVIRSLLRVLEGGYTAKAVLDKVVDACSAMQNLREAIASYRNRIYYDTNDARRQSLLQVCLEYLERYYFLIAFTAYLAGPSFDPGTPAAHATFAEWWRHRPELRSILERMLRRNPLAALSLDKSPDALAAGEAQQSAESAEQEARAALVAQRAGAVLGPHTVLMQDHFRGCQSSRLPATFPGAPNFREVPGVRVFGGAIPTVAGVTAVLAHVGAAPDSTPVNGRQARCVWHMMREEPVVYIAGQPFVLREAARPFKNLLEYRGIDPERLEQMEARLRNDVIAEAREHGGKLLVMHESLAGGGARVVETFAPLEGPDAVQTPKQVFEALQAEGYRVQYVRVPLTHGVAPRPRDFDSFYSSAAAAGPNDALIYTCQLGGGRTTTGTVIGCLLRMFLNGASLTGEQAQGAGPATGGGRLLLAAAASSLDHLDEDVGGASPRHSDDGELDDAAEHAEHAPVPDITDVDPETRNLRDGDYVGVRRFVRILEAGSDAKATVDNVIDVCGVLINLRTTIMRYRKPKTLDKFFRPELQARHTAFQRGSSYLERYCMLIAFAAYLELCQKRGRRLTFEEWCAARPDICAARDAIHQNPAGALAPLPTVLPMTPMPSLPTPVPSGRDVSLEEQRLVLMKRRGSTVGRRSILKSSAPAGGPCKALNALQLEGVADIRQAEGVPVYTLGHATVEGLRRLLDRLGALPAAGVKAALGEAAPPGGGQHHHVVVTDLREELVLYVNGSAYMRRELEMPAAALHHAGVQAVKLEDLERRLRGDMLAEAQRWGGKVLLHREVAAPARFQLRQQQQSQGSPGGPAASPRGGAKGGDGDTAGPDDITRTTDFQATARVQAFWEPTGDMGDSDQGLCTPSEVFLALAAEGYQLTYQRAPMSRERTPQPSDLDLLHKQMANHPPGASPVYLFLSRTATGSSARFAAAFACAHLDSAHDARRLCGSPQLSGLLLGIRPFALAAAGEDPGDFSPRKRLRTAHGAASAAAGTAGAAGSSPRLTPGSAGGTTAAAPGSVASSSGGSSLLRVESDLSDLARNPLLGEYRGIMNLCRVMPGGLEAKASVDEAIDRCGPGIGNLREDIMRCKTAAEDKGLDDAVSGGVLGNPQATAAAIAARRLGLHYLQRYFYLIAFRGYDHQAIAERSGVGATLAGVGPARPSAFSQWMSERRELKYLLSTLDLD